MPRNILPPIIVSPLIFVALVFAICRIIPTAHALDPVTNVMLLHRAVQICRALVGPQGPCMPRKTLLLPMEMRVSRVLARRAVRCLAGKQNHLGCLGGRLVGDPGFGDPGFGNPSLSPIIVHGNLRQWGDMCMRKKVWMGAMKRFARLRVAGGKACRYIHQWGLHGVNQAIFVVGASNLLEDEEFCPLALLVAKDLAWDATKDFLLR